MSETSTYTTYDIKAIITLFPTDQGGRKGPVRTGYRPSFSFNTEKYYCGEIRLIARKELQPGQTTKAYIKLLPAKTIRKNLKPADAFRITEGNKTIGSGIIEEVHQVVLG
jgi:translation elongation factor EF-Tu-like GTPase